MEAQLAERKENEMASKGLQRAAPRIGLSWYRGVSVMSSDFCYWLRCVLAMTSRALGPQETGERRSE